MNEDLISANRHSEFKLSRVDDHKHIWNQLLFQTCFASTGSSAGSRASSTFSRITGLQGKGLCDRKIIDIIFGDYLPPRMQFSSVRRYVVSVNLITCKRVRLATKTKLQVKCRAKTGTIDEHKILLKVSAHLLLGLNKVSICAFPAKSTWILLAFSFARIHLFACIHNLWLDCSNHRKYRARNIQQSRNIILFVLW